MKSTKAKSEETWSMPAWAEPYRDLIVNTGGNPIEEMVMDRTDASINLPRAVLAACVKSQIALLTRLHQVGALSDRERQAAVAKHCAALADRERQSLTNGGAINACRRIEAAIRAFEKELGAR